MVDLGFIPGIRVISLLKEGRDMGIRGRQNIHKLLVSPVSQCHLLSYGASSAVETVGDAVGRRGIIFYASFDKNCPE